MIESFRFFVDNQMKVITMKDLLSKQWMGLVDVPAMPAIGVKADDQPVFTGDILLLDTDKLEEKNMFWHSNLGEHMRLRGFNQAVVAINIPDSRLDVTYTLYLKKDGKFITDNEYDDIPVGVEGYEEGEGIFSTSSTGTLFIRLICNKGGVIAGNIHQNPELLPEKNC